MLASPMQAPLLAENYFGVQEWMCDPNGQFGRH